MNVSAPARPAAAVEEGLKQATGIRPGTLGRALAESEIAAALGASRIDLGAAKARAEDLVPGGELEMIEIERAWRAQGDLNPRPTDSKSGALSGLSYGRARMSPVARLGGIEPPTHGLEGRCSIP